MPCATSPFHHWCTQCLCMAPLMSASAVQSCNQGLLSCSLVPSLELWGKAQTWSFRLRGQMWLPAFSLVTACTLHAKSIFSYCIRDCLFTFALKVNPYTILIVNVWPRESQECDRSSSRNSVQASSIAWSSKTSRQHNILTSMYNSLALSKAYIRYCTNFEACDDVLVTWEETLAVFLLTRSVSASIRNKIGGAELP